MAKEEVQEGNTAVGGGSPDHHLAHTGPSARTAQVAPVGKTLHGETNQRASGTLSLQEGSFTQPRGFHSGGTAAGLKPQGLDLGMMVSEIPAVTAGVFTQNLFPAAPVTVTQESLAAGRRLKAIVVNSGNANACTGERGLDDARGMQEETARRLGVPAHQVAVASTGVIGQFLPMEKVLRGIAGVSFKEGEAGYRKFAEAICTTDTKTKTAVASLELDGRTVTISGVAKGSGMIHPNMATMLAFVTTDAAVEEAALQSILQACVDESFNQISVDGDTSTNDTVLLLANGMAGNEVLTLGRGVDQSGLQELARAVSAVCRSLARQIAQDGEGATHLIEVTVEGAQDQETARRLARSVVASNLVKTAVYGGDANWGRIIMAVGNSRATFNPQGLSVFLGEVQVVKEGLPADYSEREAAAQLVPETVQIRLVLTEGEASAEAWGCDLTEEYVRINADYRT